MIQKNVSNLSSRGYESRKETSKHALRSKETNIINMHTWPTSYAEKYLHNMSHIKIDGDDIVVYSKELNQNMINDDCVMGSIFYTKELFRIPKQEVKYLLHTILEE